MKGVTWARDKSSMVYQRNTSVSAVWLSSFKLQKLAKAWHLVLPTSEAPEGKVAACAHLLAW